MAFEERADGSFENEDELDGLTCEECGEDITGGGYDGMCEECYEKSFEATEEEW